MATASVPAAKLPNAGLTYTKRLRRAKQLGFLGPSLALFAYGELGLHRWAALSAEAVTDNFYLQLALCWVPLWMACTAASAPGLWYHFHLDRKFGLTMSNVSTWLLDSLKARGLALILGGGVVEIAFGAHKVSPEYGWLLSGILSSLLFLGMIQFFPWLMSLFYPVAPLRIDSLQQRLNQLAQRAGVCINTICEWQISKRTRKANALVAGIGRGRRILLTDTLITELTEQEIEAIVGHELGHCALHHIDKRVALQSVAFCGIFWLINLAVSNGMMAFVGENSNWDDLRLLPGFFLFWSCGYIYSSLIMALLSRRQEKAADLYCWKLIGRVEPFITAMRKLTDLNLVVFEKSSQWRYSHPPTSDRIAAAEQYSKANGRGAAPTRSTDVFGANLSG